MKGCVDEYMAMKMDEVLMVGHTTRNSLNRLQEQTSISSIGIKNEF